MNTENNRFNNNNSCDNSFSIANIKNRYVEHEKELSAVEHEAQKIIIQQDNQPRLSQGEHREDEDNDIGRNEGEPKEHDEVDSPGRTESHFIEIDEYEESNPDEQESEEAEKKKRISNTTYAAKKTVAQGMMDIALITANANQLRYLIEFNWKSSTFFLIVTLIVISLCLQVAVGVALIFKGRLDIKGKSKNTEAKRINNYVVVSIFLVTIINVFIASFTITGGNTGVQI